jgi:threonine dehydratase
MTAILQEAPSLAFERTVDNNPELLASHLVNLAEKLNDPDDDYNLFFREVVGIEQTALTQTTAVPMSGNTLLLKDETMHPTGAYKIRGAASAIIAAIEANPNLKSVTCASAGNHGMNVTYVSSLVGLDASVHVSQYATSVKQDCLRELGAKLDNSHDCLVTALDAARLEASAEDRKFIHPFDHTETMAGQATIMQEVLNQLEQSGYDLLSDEIDIVTPAGGKGMAAGCAAWLAREKTSGRVGSGVKLKVVEIENKATSTFCDGTATQDGKQTTAILSLYEDDFVEYVEVTPVEVAQAMHELTSVMHKRIEPAGALATAGAKKLAAVSKVEGFNPDGSIKRSKYKTYVSVVSGANVSDETYKAGEQLRYNHYQKRVMELSRLSTRLCLESKPKTVVRSPGTQRALSGNVIK